MDIVYGTGFQIIGPTSADDFTYSVTPTVTVTGDGSTVTTTELDTTYSMRQGTSRLITQAIGVPSDVVLTNLTPGVGTLTDGVLTPVGAGGDCTISAYRWGIGTRHINTYATAVVTSGYMYAPLSFTSGSVMAHVYDQLVAQMAANPTLDALSHKRFIVNGGDTLASPSGSNNAALWMGGVDFSPISYSREVHSNYGDKSVCLPATLVDDGQASSKFAVVATHTWLYPGDTVNFLRSNGSFVQAIVADAIVVSGDLSLVMFTSAVTGIDGVQTYGSDYLDYLPLYGPHINTTWGSGGPALFIGGQWATSPYPANSTSNVRICASGLAGGGNPFNAGDYPAFAPAFNSRAWDVWVGDSSGLTAHPVNGKLVGLGTQQDTNGGPSIVLNRTAITAAMRTMAVRTNADSTPYEMGVVDLTGFTNYG